MAAELARLIHHLTSFTRDQPRQRKVEQAINTFRQILSNDQASASVRLKAAIEISKLVESQRPTVFFEPAVERLHQNLSLAEVKQPPKPASAPVGRNAPCPCGSPLKYKRCCGNPAHQVPTDQTRAA